MKNSSLFRPRKIAYKTPATICLCIKPERLNIYIYEIKNPFESRYKCIF